MKVYITDETGFTHVADMSIGDFGGSHGVFNSDEWWSSSENAVDFYKRVTGNDPVEIKYEM